jgi:hypothetical protein
MKNNTPFNLPKTFKSAVRCPESKRWMLKIRRGTYTCPHRSIFLLGRKHSVEARAKAKDGLGRKVLEDFYGKCDEAAGGGFEQVKLGYAYEYVDHVSGEVAAMEPTEPPPLDDTLCFDGLVMCSGTNTWSSLPAFEGQDKFKGPIIHSENYKKPHVFAGKRVLIVGAGEVKRFDFSRFDSGPGASNGAFI